MNDEPLEERLRKKSDFEPEYLKRDISLDYTERRFPIKPKLNLKTLIKLFFIGGLVSVSVGGIMGFLDYGKSSAPLSVVRKEADSIENKIINRLKYQLLILERLYKNKKIGEQEYRERRKQITEKLYEISGNKK